MISIGTLIYSLVALAGGAWGAKIAKANVLHGVLAVLASVLIGLGLQVMAQTIIVVGVAQVVVTILVAMAFGMNFRQAVIVLVVSQALSFAVAFLINFFWGLESSLTRQPVG
ncbi:hypothetical protein FPY71_08865 [Aureimonas fodinaquatilis]|uniref:Uncharacterized protein n=1 Tax=Aureimonas fodinaquatilis TaxID=2565783 RepID=A0A5B0DZG5_9HYPH|nr:hypothetical protein [Aureimonas fodinaquatilis]KAA0970599.1 hypothetical protein FPY71_08865 [Aureimonas fodinaquatilis]